MKIYFEQNKLYIEHKAYQWIIPAIIFAVMFFAGLTVLNYRNCQKVIPYILYQAFMLVCIICAGYASTYLYYHNISNDFMTPVVGELMTLLGASISIVATVISAVVKAVINKKRAV